MHVKLDKQEDTTIVAKATNKKKNTEHTRMYIFFLDFLHHYSQQKSAVRSTAIQKKQHKKLKRGGILSCYSSHCVYVVQ